MRLAFLVSQWPRCVVLSGAQALATDLPQAQKARIGEWRISAVRRFLAIFLRRTAILLPLGFAAGSTSHTASTTFSSSRTSSSLLMVTSQSR